MAQTPLNIRSKYNGDTVAEYIAATWQRFNSNRQAKINEWTELRNYIFATDTSKTTNASLPWKNSTTIPKLCQIRDNLHSNYVSALFPNDEWLTWEGYSKEDAIFTKKRAIEAYMSNKTRESHFRIGISQLLYDFIDYGNAFGTVYYENSFITNESNEKIPRYIGPRLKRISPLDIVFDPLAGSFEQSFKIIRSLRSIGELQIMAEEEPDNLWLANAIKNRAKLFQDRNGSSKTEENNKFDSLNVDGFGSYADYLNSEKVEFLDFYGDIAEADGSISKGQHITVIDRMWVVNKEVIKSWAGIPPIFHVGWRRRPDNIWAMGPLDNLVGMQYRIDHLENAKADAMDLAILPPLVIKGEVEEFEWAPGAEIHIDENGEVSELARNVQWVIQADNAIDRLEMRMEQYAGAPREAMGIRSAGEKTAFEVQQLQNASGRIFQEKITMFEVEMLEPIMNAMVEVSKRNLDRMDVARVMDDDLGVEAFLSITKEDITASGKLRAIGARHFAAQAQMIQNLTGLANTPIWAQIAPHMSGKAMAKLVEDSLNLDRFKLFTPNAAVFEQQETQRLMNQASEDLQVEQSTPPVA